MSEETQKKFSDFDIAEDVLRRIQDMGIENPTPIQELCIGPILAGRDVVGKAETGTGKTLGFGAPLVNKIDTQRVATQALVLTPTRELAQQVAGVIEELGVDRDLGVVLLVGGVHASEQLLKLRSGSQIVVGTPGRVLDFLRERLLSLVWCETVVLDEADRMLDMGFIDDVTEILKRTPEERQTMLFSATVPPEINKILKSYMKDPEIFSTTRGVSAAEEITQKYVETSFNNKFRELRKILDEYSDGPVIIFCNTRRQTIDLDRMLWGNGYSAAALHGDQEQDVRFKVLETFRNGEVRILVCTDVASRGLDIDEVSCVVNYEIPDEEDSYVHRIGRTGRASRTGVAVSLVAPRERASWERILKAMNGKIERVGSARSGRDSSRGDSRRKGEGARGSSGRGGRRRRSSRSSGERSEHSERSSGERSEHPERSSRSSGERSERSSRSSGERSEGGRDGDESRRGRESRSGSRRGGRGQRRASSDDNVPVAASSASSEAEESTAESRDSSRPQGGYSSRPPQAGRKRELLPLDSIDDDFVKTDYFEVDESRLARTGGSRPSGGSSGSSGSSGSTREGGEEGGGENKRGGRRSRGRGRRAGRRRGQGSGGGSGGGGSGEGGGESSSAGSEGSSAGEGRSDGGEGKSRRRPRRRPRRRSGSRKPDGGEGGSGSQGSSGSPGPSEPSN